MRRSWIADFQTSRVLVDSGTGLNRRIRCAEPSRRKEASRVGVSCERRRKDREVDADEDEAIGGGIGASCRMLMTSVRCTTDFFFEDAISPM